VVADREKSLPLSKRMADDQSSSKSWRSNTDRFKKGSFNGVPIRPALAKEAIATRKK
jgi:hypothetical protein